MFRVFVTCVQVLGHKDKEGRKQTDDQINRVGEKGDMGVRYAQ
jgi:hypothetical protein